MLLSLSALPMAGSRPPVLRPLEEDIGVHAINYVAMVLEVLLVGALGLLGCLLWRRTRSICELHPFPREPSVSIA